MHDGGIAKKDAHPQPGAGIHPRSESSRTTRLEEQLRRSQKMEALANLAGGIAHDFNNILQTILCHLQLSLLKSDEVTAEETYRRIEPIINKGSELAKQLMAFGRRNRSETELVNLNGKIQAAHAMLERTIPKMIEIQLDLDPDLESMCADGGQIEQVLMNLAINAKDAMPDGGRLTFRTETVRSRENLFLRAVKAEADRYVLLTVSDTGCGIPQKHMETVFEPFFTTKKKGEGTGLGLSMVYGIVKNHGGLIECSSEEGKGTAFRIYFPIGSRVSKAPQIPDRGVVEEVRGGEESILLVDDEVTILEVWGELLKRYGYRVRTAAHGEEALTAYREKPCDLVILDVNMPGMGGLRFLEELLEMDRRATVLISSGYSLNGLVKKALHMGAQDFLPKPYSIHQLLKTVRETLDAGPSKVPSESGSAPEPLAGEHRSVSLMMQRRRLGLTPV